MINVKKIIHRHSFLYNNLRLYVMYYLRINNVGFDTLSFNVLDYVYYSSYYKTKPLKEILACLGIMIRSS